MAMNLSDADIYNLRHGFTQNLLKNALIRIDYSGVNNIDSWIQDNQGFMQSYFDSYERGMRNQALLRLTSPEDIAKTLSIPVDEVKKVTVHEFNQWKGKEMDFVTMLVTNYYMTLNTLQQLQVHRSLPVSGCQVHGIHVRQIRFLQGSTNWHKKNRWWHI